MGKPTIRLAKIRAKIWPSWTNRNTSLLKSFQKKFSGLWQQRMVRL
jgi:hypothetical protein